MTDPFDSPTPIGQLDLNTVRDQLVLIKPKQERTFKTKFSDESPATICDVHVLTGPQAGLCHYNVTIWAVILRNFLSDKVATGRFGLGRVTKIVTKEGNDAWALSEASEDEKGTARRYLDSDCYRQNAARSTMPAPPPPPTPPVQQVPGFAPQQSPPPSAGNGDPWGAAPAPAPAADPWGTASAPAPAGPATPFGPESPF